MDALQDKGLTWHKKWEKPLLPLEDCGTPSRHSKSTALPLTGAGSQLLPAPEDTAGSSMPCLKWLGLKDL